MTGQEVNRALVPERREEWKMETRDIWMRYSPVTGEQRHNS